MSGPDATGETLDAGPNPYVVGISLFFRLLIVALLAAVLAASLKWLCSLLVEWCGVALLWLAGVTPWPSLGQHLSEAGKSMLAPLALALAASGLSGTALVATFKECAKAIEGVLSEFPNVTPKTRFKAGYSVGISLTALFATIIFARTFVKIDEAREFKIDTTVAVPNFKPGDVLGIAVPFSTDAGRAALMNAAPVASRETGVDLNESTRAFLRDFGASLAACRDGDRPVKVIVEGYASRSPLKTEKPLSRDTCSGDPACLANFNDVEKLAKRGGTDSSLDDGFNLWAAWRRASNVAACLSGHKTCSVKDDHGVSGLKWDNKEVSVRDWKDLPEMRSAGQFNESNSGLVEVKERVMRGAIARYALIRVKLAGKCHEDELATAPLETQ